MDSGVPRTSRQRRGALLLFTASLLTSGTLGRLPTSAPARLTVHGSVRESSGSPVPGAQILRVASQVVQSCPDLFLGSRANLWLAAGWRYAESEESVSQATVRVDSQGQFGLAPQDPDRPEIVLVIADGYAPHLQPLSSGSSNVVLREGNDVTVHFLTPEDKIVEGAEAILVPLFICGPVVRAFRDRLVWRGRGNAQGEIRLLEVPDGTYALRVTAKGRRVSTVAPLLVQRGDTEFRIRVPQGRSAKGSVLVPPRAIASSGTVLAFWNDPDSELEWTEASFSGEDVSFELDGLPYLEPVSLLAKTENGLSSRVMPLPELIGTRDAPGKPILLKSPVSWSGRLQDGVRVSSLIVEPLMPSFFPPSGDLGAFSVSVGTDGAFLIPDVPPEAEGLRLTAPPFGEVDAPLEESASGDLGVLKLRAGPTVRGKVFWEDDSPMQEGAVEVPLGLRPAL